MILSSVSELSEGRSDPRRDSPLNLSNPSVENVETILKLLAILERGIETRLKLFAILEAALDAHLRASESVLTHDFFHYRRTRTAKMAGLKLF